MKFPALATLPTALIAAAATTTLFDNPPNPSPPKSPLPADLLPTSPLPADSPPTNPLALTRPLAPFAAPFVAFAARLAAALLTRNPPFAALSPLALTSSAAATSPAASPSLLPPKLFDALFASCLLDSILASAFALFFARPVSKRLASSLCFAPLNASASFAPPLTSFSNALFCANFSLCSSTNFSLNFLPAFVVFGVLVFIACPLKLRILFFI